MISKAQMDELQQDYFLVTSVVGVSYVENNLIVSLLF